MSRDTVVVTYLGGPEDLTRRVHPREDMARGCWFVLCVRPQYSQEYLRDTSLRDLMLPTIKARYDFIRVPSNHGEQWLAIYNEVH
ncbi:hypothetical protein [Stenotrophomonas phage BUCT598]|uniref:Uncharacterized protein n=1 Tax=Stenotrophomonas phage BUCT598 TaxID=2834253 RepID=A0A8F2F3Z0_9CAUD|nr:hypothetical protein [Stenotrophomonas phage BUCT598]